MGKGETIVYNQLFGDSKAHIAAIASTVDVVAAVVVEQLISVFPISTTNTCRTFRLFTAFAANTLSHTQRLSDDRHNNALWASLSHFDSRPT